MLALLALLLAACGGGGDDGLPAAVDEVDVWSLADPGEIGVDEAVLARVDDRIPAEFPNVRSQWWVQDGPRGKAYAALGFAVQAIVVFPALDLVVVLTTVPRGDTDVRAIIRLILPAVESR